MASAEMNCSRCSWNEPLAREIQGHILAIKVREQAGARPKALEPFLPGRLPNPLKTSALLIIKSARGVLGNPRNGADLAAALTYSLEFW